ncbi:hypothetical protein SLS57_011532 [Botryosphaeria dothidea]
MENHTTDPDHHHLAPGEQLSHAEALAASLAAQMWEMDLLEEKQLAYNDLKDAIHKFAARIFTKKFYTEGSSQLRSDHESVFSIFGDAARSERIPEQLAKIRSQRSKSKVKDRSRKWTVVGIAYKKKDNDKE